MMFSCLLLLLLLSLPALFFPPPSSQKAERWFTEARHNKARELQEVCHLAIQEHFREASQQSGIAQPLREHGTVHQMEHAS